MKTLVNKMLKKSFLFFVVFIALINIVKAQATVVNDEIEKIEIHFFYSNSCPHCKKEKEFLDEYIKPNDKYVINQYEINSGKDSIEKFTFAIETLNIESSGVPLTIIGNKYVIGYKDYETSGVEILNILNKCENVQCISIFNENNLNQSSVNYQKEKQNDILQNTNNDQVQNLGEFFGINLNKVSLPVLTIIIGFLDGFNPCAMWVLLFLISLLIGLKDKKKMYTLGITFIVASSLVYFMFMVAWLKLFQFLGFVIWVRLIIALIALIGGAFSFKKAIASNTGCEVEESEKRKEIFNKLAKITTQNSFILSIIGIIGLAFAVNLVELVCSSGFPAVYTKVLSLNNLSSMQYYLYILLYILFFMIDDLFVFIIAMITLEMTGITTKYVKYTRLIGGLLMIIIGLLLIFKPEILMFG